MKTYFDLYKAVLAGVRDPVDLKLHFGLDDDRLEAAMQPLREAKIVQAITVVMNGARYFEVLHEARDEGSASTLANDAGLDLSRPI